MESAETALSLLEDDGKDAYAQALAAIPDSTAEWFLEASEEEDRFGQDTEGLARFLSAKVVPIFNRIWPRPKARQPCAFRPGAKVSIRSAWTSCLLWMSA